jgi:transposase-like protein
LSPVRNRPIYCPRCQSPDIKIAARLTTSIECICHTCGSEFSVKQEDSRPASGSSRVPPRNRHR